MRKTKSFKHYCSWCGRIFTCFREKCDVCGSEVVHKLVCESEEYDGSNRNESIGSNRKYRGGEENESL